MPLITITDLQNAKEDVDHIAAIANSSASTATDRLGQTKKTMAGVLAEAQSAADAAAAGAQGYAQTLSVRLAEAASLANSVGLGARPVYVSTSAGLAVTANGARFYVPHATIANRLIQYTNVSGVATDTGRRFNQTTGEEIGTAISLLDTEAEGIAIDATCEDASVRVKVVDAVTPANNYQGNLVGFLASTCFPAPKMVTLADGSLGWSDHNHFFDSERPDLGNWVRTGMTAGAPSGGYSTLTSTAASASAWQSISNQLRGYFYTVNYVFKAGTSPYVFLRLETSFASLLAYFNISAGSVGAVDSGLTATIHTTDVDGSALPAGEYRCQVIHQAGTSGTFSLFRVHAGLADASGSTTVTVGRTALFRKSQANWGAKATGYLVTTAGAKFGIPFDFSKGGRRVLIEELSGTYNSRYSEDLTQTSFWTATNVTTTLDQTGPSGEPCSKLVATSAGAIISQSVASAFATNTFQAYIKRLVGTGTIEMSADGVTWTDVTAQINSTGYTRCYVHRSNTAVTMQIRIGTSGDSIAVSRAVNCGRGVILSSMPTYDPGTGGTYARAADVFRVPTTKFHLGSDFTFFADFETSGDTAAIQEQVGMIGAGDIHGITHLDGTLLSRNSNVGGTAANNFAADISTRIEGAMRIKANDIATSINGMSEVYDSRIGVGTLSNIFAGSAGGQVFLRRLLHIPRSLPDDGLQYWRWSRTGQDSRYLADMKVAKFGEVANTHINREPNVEVLGDTDEYALLGVMHMQRNINANTSTGEAPGRIVFKQVKFDKITKALSLVAGPVVVAQQAGWATGLGHVQGPVQIKIKQGANKGRLGVVYAQLDTANGLISPDGRNLYYQYSDDNGATWSAQTKIYDSGTGKYAVTTGPGSAVQIRTGTYAGRILVPFGTNASGADRPGVIYSDDGGATWTTAMTTTTTTGFEPTVHLLPDERTIVMTIRQEGTPWRTYVTSTNGGGTWSSSTSMTSLASEGVNVGMAMVQNDPNGDRGMYGEQLLVGVRHTSPTYLIRSKLTIEAAAGSGLTLTGTQFNPLGVYRSCGYVSAQRLGGGYVVIGYESAPTGVANSICDIRLMVVRWPA